jgi:hypothetical protein
MDIIEIKTLVDITKTGVFRLNQGSQLELDQNRNFTTLLQCLELRSIVGFGNDPATSTNDLKTSKFGSNFKGKHQVWTFEFNPDRTGAYLDDENNYVGNLIRDLDQVPIIKNLTETININRAVFDLTSDKDRNTIVIVKSPNLGIMAK